ncbi:hypothetical protein T4E_11826 [Trichinella pseudospiralis]|uniref:Uncharacterized protein n=1 Tax=Trichinella pseudospiralis TaxID=6337 RepID=A0A0V0XN54_TRIPS|nr:hypothetical protein T4E_11826 [Trichinella pseudospiralis]
MGKVLTLQNIHLSSPTLYHFLISRYVTHLEKKPSKAIAIKASRNAFSHKTNDVNWSEKIQNPEWIWSHIARLRISRDIAEITYGTENIVLVIGKEIKYVT